MYWPRPGVVTNSSRYARRLSVNMTRCVWLLLHSGCTLHTLNIITYPRCFPRRWSRGACRKWRWTRPLPGYRCVCARRGCGELVEKPQALGLTSKGMMENARPSEHVCMHSCDQTRDTCYSQPILAIKPINNHNCQTSWSNAMQPTTNSQHGASSNT